MCASILVKKVEEFEKGGEVAVLQVTWCGFDDGQCLLKISNYRDNWNWEGYYVVWLMQYMHTYVRMYV